jgi:hypothetical protein
LYADAWKLPDIYEPEVEAYLKMVGQIPPQLFKTAHHSKKKFKTMISEGTISIPAPQDSTIHLDGGFAMESSSGLRKNAVFFSLPDTLYVCQFGKDKQYASLPTSRKKVFSNVNSVRSFRDGIMVGTGNNAFTYVVPTSDGCQMHPVALDRTIISVAVSGEWFSASSDDFITTIYSVHREGPVWEFRSYRGPFTCTALSDVFKIHVTGTSDGTLVVSSLTTGKSVRVINLGDVTPIAVMVTPAWGFLVTYSYEIINDYKRYVLSAHTINGELIKKRNINVDLKCYTVFSSPAGFDYFAYFVGCQLYVCEVFFLVERVVPTGFRGKSAVHMLTYDQDLAAFVLINEHNVIELIGYIPDDFADICIKY